MGWCGRGGSGGVGSGGRNEVHAGQEQQWWGRGVASWSSKCSSK